MPLGMGVSDTILFYSVYFIAVDIVSIVMYNTLSYRGTAVTWNDVFGVSTAVKYVGWIQTYFYNRYVIYTGYTCSYYRIYVITIYH